MESPGFSPRFASRSCQRPVAFQDGPCRSLIFHSRFAQRCRAAGRGGGPWPDQWTYARRLAPGTCLAPRRHLHCTALGEGVSCRTNNARMQERVRSHSSTSSSGARDGVHTEPAASAGRGTLQLPQRLGQSSSSGTGTVVTFAYGANMNWLTLARRDVRVLSRDPAVVADPAIRLVFKHQGGYATLERADETESQAEPRFRSYDGQVHGVLYRVTREDFDKLAKREGGYVIEEVKVQTYDGTPYTALAFVSNPLFKLPEEVTPTEKYLSTLREGARDNYLDPGYQAFLSGISTVPSAGLGAEYYNTPSKYMGYSFLVVVALITLAFFSQH